MIEELKERSFMIMIEERRIERLGEMGCLKSSDRQNT